MSTLFPIVKLGSRAGRSTLSRLVRRAAPVVRKAARRAEEQVEAVRAGGDRALLAAVRKADGVAAESVAALALTPALDDATELPAGFAEAFERALVAVERFHAPQAAERQAGYRIDEEGVELTAVVTPLARVGIYVPGGGGGSLAAVLLAIPARLAGVAEIAVAVPPAAYRSSAPLRYALERLALREVWGMGGAAAIAALAYGTETLRRVDKIVGPGDAAVAAAKRRVSGEVGIDGLAGPGELVIVADPGTDPEPLAADLLAQAERDPRAAAVLVTTDPKLARQVAGALERQLAALAPAAAATAADIARAALSACGAALVVADVEEALGIVERLAPERLRLVGLEAEGLASLVHVAGAVFVGATSPEGLGAHLAGPSPLLPAGGSARFASGLGVADFLRRSHRLRFTPEAAAHRAAAAAVLAEAEGLPAHAAAARLRLR